ncbi:MAG: methyltransferase [Opitutales bacterium]|jgi:hypothetical protein|nr:methyltransferase [Opitutales bacterium]
MTPKQRIRASIDHQEPDKLPIDFGSSGLTSFHCSVVEQLRDHYKLEKRPVTICEPYQMLGEVDEDLLNVMGIDAQAVPSHANMFGFANENWKPWTTPWDQNVLVPERFNTTSDNTGNIYIYPQGDTDAPASGRMPKTSYFFDSIERLDPDFDEDDLNLEDNLEEFGPMSQAEETHWVEQAAKWRGCERAVTAGLSGTGLGDIALVPAPFLKNPKGVRGVADWYMLSAEEPEFLQGLFDRQTEIALQNIAKVHKIVGDVIDVVMICGTDFGTQNSLFCGVPQVRDIWLPRYKQINEWIHQNTSWRTFKHSCGAVEPLIETFIDCGFDILNPVQCSANGMEPEGLKANYGDRITFWGGGVNTQQTLPFGTPEQVREEVLSRCEIFAPGGGFVFNAIHNVQARTPVENVVAMIDAVHEYNGDK